MYMFIHTYISSLSNPLTFSPLHPSFLHPRPKTSLVGQRLWLPLPLLAHGLVGGCSWLFPCNCPWGRLSDCIWARSFPFFVIYSLCLLRSFSLSHTLILCRLYVCPVCPSVRETLNSTWFCLTRCLLSFRFISSRFALLSFVSFVRSSLVVLHCTQRFVYSLLFFLRFWFFLLFITFRTQQMHSLSVVAKVCFPSFKLSPSFSLSFSPGVYRRSVVGVIIWRSSK